MIPRYSRPQMAAIWSDAHRLQLWLEIEVAVCEARAHLGEIPPAEVEQIRQRAGFDLERVQEREQATQHDVAAFVDVVAERIGPAARHVHFGMTSSDVLDTSLALQLRDSGRLLLAGTAALAAVLRRRALEFQHTPMAGRTHGMHAEPITFGLKLLGLYAEVRRAEARLQRAVESVAVGKLSGAVGTFAHLGPEVEELVCERLGLRWEPVATQVVPRDRHAEFVASVALLGAGLERLGTEVRHLQRTEVQEVEEPFEPGQKGSSAMPHKRNPIRSERIVGLARLLRAHVVPALENVTLWHERDISHSSVERILLPDICLAADYMLDLATRMLDGLVVYPERMQRNLDSTGGLVFSQSLLLELVRAGLERDPAYRLVQDASRSAWESGRPLRDVALETRGVVDALGRAGVERVFDLQHHLRHVDRIFARGLGGDSA
jgi:adenylosuccinate lyase